MHVLLQGVAPAQGEGLLHATPTLVTCRAFKWLVVILEETKIVSFVTVLASSQATVSLLCGAVTQLHL